MYCLEYIEHNERSFIKSDKEQAEEDQAKRIQQYLDKRHAKNYYKKMKKRREVH